MIKNLGKIGFITPDTWINIPQAKKLREFTLRNFSIDQILTFGQSVFADASVNAIVFILQRGSKRTSCEVIHIDKSNFDQLMSAVEATFLDVNRWDNSDDKQFQIWQNDLDISIINKMKTNTKAGEEYLDVSQGIVPYSTENLTKEEVKAKIFHSDRKEGDDYGPWIQGRSINRFGVDLSDKQYLKYGDWLHRSREKKYFEGKRILIQEITGGTPPRICASIHDKILYHNPGIITCLNISKLSTEYILGIINSKLLSWYHLKTSPKGKRTTFPKVLIGDIRNFPIKEPARKVEESIKSLVQDNLELVQSLLSLEGRFNKLLLSKFDNDKLSRKLQSWHDLTFKQFLAELKKKKVTLSLKKEAEWMEYFNEQKAKAEELKSQIAQTDKKIDAIVYDLYGLSEDEVRIVEGS